MYFEEFYFVAKTLYYIFAFNSCFKPFDLMNKIKMKRFFSEKLSTMEYNVCTRLLSILIWKRKLMNIFIYCRWHTCINKVCFKFQSLNADFKISNVIYVKKKIIIIPWLIKNSFKSQTPDVNIFLIIKVSYIDTHHYVQSIYLIYNVRCLCFKSNQKKSNNHIWYTYSRHTICFSHVLSKVQM